MPIVRLVHSSRWPGEALEKRADNTEQQEIKRHRINQPLSTSIIIIISISKHFVNDNLNIFLSQNGKF